MTFDDAALIAGARQGSAEAVDSLYRRYWPIAWQWAYALTGHRQRADDLAQDAVLSAFASLGRFDVERPFRPWLKRILLNRSIDELRHFVAESFPSTGSTTGCGRTARRRCVPRTSWSLRCGRCRRRAGS
jgi:RNA polymerase sigma factor (sigma-70 family)